MVSTLAVIATLMALTISPASSAHATTSTFRASVSGASKTVPLFTKGKFLTVARISIQGPPADSTYLRDTNGDGIYRTYEVGNYDDSRAPEEPEVYKFKGGGAAQLQRISAPEFDYPDYLANGRSFDLKAKGYTSPGTYWVKVPVTMSEASVADGFLPYYTYRTITVSVKFTVTANSSAMKLLTNVSIFQAENGDKKVHLLGFTLDNVAGKKITVYKRSNGKWRKIYSARLKYSYSHQSVWVDARLKNLKSDKGTFLIKIPRTKWTAAYSQKIKNH